MYGSGYSAGCRLDSIGRASGSCRAAGQNVKQVQHPKFQQEKTSQGIYEACC